MKRIICSILVVVMLVLSLAGCGYSFRKDSMTNYASFTDKEGFAAALMGLLIEDGDFKLDAAVREEKVLENIYSAISSAISSDAEKLKEGKPSVRDVVYYAYYATADFDGVTSVFYTDKLKTASPSKIQLRTDNDFGKDTLSAGFAKLLAAYEFSKRDVHTATTSGKTVEGDIAYVTYTKQENGADKSTTFTNQRIEIGAAPAAGAKATDLASYLSGKSINSTIEKIELTEGEKTYTYSAIKVNFVVSRILNGATAEGDKAYITYNVKNADGDGKTNKVTNELIVVGAAPAEGAAATDLASFISGKDIASTVKDENGASAKLTLKKTITVKENGVDVEKEIDVVYSDVQINWVAGDDAAIGTFTDVTYEEVDEDEDKTEVTDTNGEKRVLNGKEITYYVYPVYYVETPEFTAELLIDKVLGKNLSESSIYQILFVNEYAALDDDATQADVDKINEQAAKYKSGELSIKDLVSKITAYYTDIETAETGIESAQTALDNATEKYDSAKDAYDKAVAAGKTGSELDTLKKAYEDADKALNDKDNGAQANYEKAVKNKENVESKKAENIKKLLEIKAEGEEDTLAVIIERNYKILNYNSLQDSYNEELRMNLAAEINYYLDKYITLGDKLPEDAVEEAYKQFYEAYESDFYNGTYDSTNKITNYKQYNGNFEKFLMAKVAEDEGITVDTAKAAEDALWAKAKETVGEIVKVYLLAEAYDLTITKDEYNEYKDELEDYYYYYVLYYKNFNLEEMIGKTNIEAACQFDKVINYFLKFEEVKGEADANGYIQITYKYTSGKVAYEFGEPASKN